MRKISISTIFIAVCFSLSLQAEDKKVEAGQTGPLEEGYIYSFCHRPDNYNSLRFHIEIRDGVPMLRDVSGYFDDSYIGPANIASSSYDQDLGEVTIGLGLGSKRKVKTFIIDLENNTLRVDSFLERLNPFKKKPLTRTRYETLEFITGVLVDDSDYAFRTSAGYRFNMERFWDLPSSKSLRLPFVYQGRPLAIERTPSDDYLIKDGATLLAEIPAYGQTFYSGIPSDRPNGGTIEKVRMVAQERVQSHEFKPNLDFVVAPIIEPAGGRNGPAFTVRLLAMNSKAVKIPNAFLDDPRGQKCATRIRLLAK